MDPMILTARPRSRTGKGSARQARRDGFVPAVVYGQHAESRVVEVDAREFGRLLRAQGTAAVVRLELGEGIESPVALIKDVQREPVTHHAIHIDFLSVALDVRVTVAVPLEFDGEPLGVKRGGIVQHNLVELEVECLPLSIPHSITVDQSGVGVGEHLTAGEIALPEGVTLVTNADEPVVLVSEPSVSEAEDGAEAADGEAATATDEGTA